MTTGSKVAIVALAYVAVGAGVLLWTISRAEDGKPSFGGFADNQAASVTAMQTIVAWPFAVVKTFGA